jgi:8-oxo-dGTP pyrophosphatase MutT (NUDIX family)
VGLVHALAAARPDELSRNDAVPDTAAERQAAVLILDDTGPPATAIREAAEETGVDPAGVEPLILLPRLHIRPSRFDVTGVLAHGARHRRLARSTRARPTV